MIKNLYILTLFNLYIIEKNMLNKFEEAFKNNFLILDFFFHFTLVLHFLLLSFFLQFSGMDWKIIYIFCLIHFFKKKI